jgi:hypothetical protein
MDNYSYKLSFTEVSHLLDLLSQQNDDLSARVEIELTVQLSNWKVWHQKLTQELDNEPKYSFTGI